LATLVFLKAGWFPPVVTRDDRVAYIHALEIADDDNLQPLIDLLVRKQRLALMDALSARDAVQPPAILSAAIKMAGQAYRHKMAVSDERLTRAVKVADFLADRVQSLLGNALSELQLEVQQVDPKFLINQRGDSPPHSLHESVTQASGYPVNLQQQYSKLVFQRFGRDLENGISVWFHGIGKEHHGVLGAAAHFVSGETVTSVSDPFLFSHKEDPGRLLVRFDTWLQKALSAAIWKWRSSL
jgi:hypothetical protein